MTNNGAKISIDGSGTARISGALTLDTVADVYRRASAEAAKGRHIANIDLSAISRVDSSGLALLLEWQATADRKGRTLQILEAPSDLLSLASLCEASGLLDIAGRSQPPSQEAGNSGVAPEPRP